MDNLTTLLAYFVTLSVACERLVEILKTTFLKDRVKNGAVWQLLALFFGAAIGYFQPIPLDLKIPVWLNIIVTGAVVSGGSGFWNSILGTMTEFKKSIGSIKSN